MTEFKEADVSGVEVVNGEPRLQIGRSDGTGLGAGVPMWGMFHYWAVPNSPNSAGSPNVIYVQDGNRIRVIAGRDNRFSSLAGDLHPGDWMFASSGEGRLIHKVEKDSITAYTVNQKTGKSMMVHLDGAAGVIQVANGGSRIDMDGDKIILSVGGGASITLDGNTITLMAGEIHLDGGSVTVGLIGGTIRPVLPTNAALYGVAPATVSSTTVTIAT